jgi:hypothetical protein
MIKCRIMPIRKDIHIGMLHYKVVSLLHLPTVAKTWTPFLGTPSFQFPSFCFLLCLFVWSSRSYIWNTYLLLTMVINRKHIRHSRGLLSSCLVKCTRHRQTVETECERVNPFFIGWTVFELRMNCRICRSTVDENKVGFSVLVFTFHN